MVGAEMTAGKRLVLVGGKGMLAAAVLAVAGSIFQPDLYLPWRRPCQGPTAALVHMP